MIECLCGSKEGVMAQIMAVKPEEFIDPPKSGGIFEVLDQRMNDFEKAAYTVMHRINQLMLEKSSAVEKGEIAQNKKGNVVAEIRELSDKFFMIKGLLYFSIQDRLNRWDCSLGISQGFKIIVPEKNDTIKGIEIEIPIPGEIAEMLKSLMKGDVPVSPETTVH